HAREPGSLSQLIFYMYYLLENYDSDAEVKYLVDNNELYFIPCVNPDGYVYNESTDPGGGGMWRKNRRYHGGLQYGVDLNRNYGHQWGLDNTGSSNYTDAETYRGASAFSEPEAGAVKYLCESHNFRIAMNYHTYGNLLIYPWGYTASNLTPDSSSFVNFASLMTLENQYTFGTGDQTVGYITNGDADDWMYGEQNTKNKIFSMTPEVGESSSFGFWHPSSRIEGLCKENLWQNLAAAHLLGNYSKIEDTGSRFLGEGSGYLTYLLTKIGLKDTGDITVTIKVLSPGFSFLDSTNTYSDLSLLSEISDSIAYTADSANLEIGAEISFVYIISNDDGYIYTDTVQKIYGKSTFAFEDEAGSMNNWASISWDVTTDKFYSPNNSFTDSPNDDYGPNNSLIMTLSEPVDLSDASSAYLDFWAIWEIETNYDYAQVEVSEDSTSWIPLCGKYTVTGNSYQDDGNPVFHGFQTTWVNEVMSLEDYIGKLLYIRFKLMSDTYQHFDGIHIDDITVTKVTCASNTLTLSADFDVNINGPTVTFTNGSIAAGKFSWYFGDGNTGSAQNPVHVYSDTGKYEVMLIASNECATDTISKDVIVTTMVGIEDLKYSASNIRVIPNPNQGTFIIEVANHDIDKIELYDQYGRLINSFINLEHLTDVTVEGLNQGLYFLKLQRDSHFTTKKILVIY
ncbi:immune inhibitor A, partial [bacterium AH-315-C07]|nr:immune inhibitor A [bacterium AH-315-C07]